MDRALKELKIRAKKLLKAYNQDPQILDAFEKILRKQKWHSKHDPELYSKQELKLKDCQNLLAIKCGFKDWQEAQQTLCGKVVTGKTNTEKAVTEQKQFDVNTGDFSGFWHSSSCDVLLNHWLASYEEAKQILLENPGKVLLPYKRQFVVVGTEYLHIIGLTDNSANLLSSIKRDLFKSYGSNEWDELAKQVLIAKLNK